MADAKMMAHVKNHPGFPAALDQSGGSTAGALKLYGIPESDYANPAGMFRLKHGMRARIITAPAFNGSKVIAAILFEQTMEGGLGRASCWASSVFMLAMGIRGLRICDNGVVLEDLNDNTLARFCYGAPWGPKWHFAGMSANYPGLGVLDSGR